jgi:menaquinone-dependent protoporphyrinogen oxidase
MVDILVIFESKYGHSQRVAQFVADIAGRRGIVTKIVRIEAASGLDVHDHDAVVIVAPIYFGRHPPLTEAYLRARADVLSMVPTAFVAVSNSAASADPKARKKAETIARAFVTKTGVRARLVVAAGGAFAYPRYAFLLRLAMKLIAFWTGAPTDTSRVHELTDWDALERAFTTFFDVLENILRRWEPEQGASAKAPDGRGSPEDSGLFRIAGQAVLTAIR